MGQIRVIQVDLKIIYLLSRLCWLIQIWSKLIYIQPKPMKSVLGSYCIHELCQTLSVIVYI